MPLIRACMYPPSAPLLCQGKKFRTCNARCRTVSGWSWLSGLRGIVCSLFLAGLNTGHVTARQVGCLRHRYSFVRLSLTSSRSKQQPLIHNLILGSNFVSHCYTRAPHCKPESPKQWRERRALSARFPLATRLVRASPQSSLARTRTLGAGPAFRL
jgi:hypothetical protein